MQAALDAIQIHGANGYSNEFPVERYLRNSKAAVIYEGTSQLHTLIQADYALGYREDRPLRCEPWPAQGFSRPGLTAAARSEPPVSGRWWAGPWGRRPTVAAARDRGVAGRRFAGATILAGVGRVRAAGDDQRDRGDDHDRRDDRARRQRLGRGRASRGSPRRPG